MTKKEELTKEEALQKAEVSEAYKLWSEDADEILDSVSDTSMHLDFYIDNLKLRIDKTRGFVGKLLPAERFLNISMTDYDGWIAGDYDNVINSLLSIVSLMTDDGERHFFDEKWQDSIVGQFVERDKQPQFLMAIPLSVAVVMLGKQKAASVQGFGINYLEEMQQKA